MSPIQTVAIFCAKDLIILLLIASLIWFIWKIDKSERSHVLLFGFITLSFAFVVSLVAAKLYNNPRPFAVAHFTPLVSHGFDNGFPSDHTLLSAAIAGVVWRYSRIFGTVFFVLTIIIGASRMYVGVHHFVDILGALVIAISSALLTSTCQKIYSNRKS